MNQIPLRELTVSLFRASAPKELLNQISKEGYIIEKQSPGIYYVNGLSVPTQLAIQVKKKPVGTGKKATFPRPRFEKGGFIMMYPFMTLKVYIETPDNFGGFHSATCWLPEYKWENIEGYSDSEMAYFKQLIRNNAHLIIEFSQDGGILNASNF